MTDEIDNKKVDQIIKECEDFFGVTLKEKPKITFLYSREEMDKVAERKTEPWVRAITRPDGIYFIHSSKIEELTTHKNDNFWAVVKHEISHWLYSEITGSFSGYPRWLTEGLAEYMAGKKLAVPMYSDDNITSKYFSFTDDMVYHWGPVLVEELIKMFGKDKVVGLVKRIYNGMTEEDFSNLFKEQFGISLTDFEKKSKSKLIRP
jgi:hypothetical protein